MGKDLTKVTIGEIREAIKAAEDKIRPIIREIENTVPIEVNSIYIREGGRMEMTGKRFITSIEISYDINTNQYWDGD